MPIDREKLVAEMLVAFHHAPTSTLLGSMSAALAVAEPVVRADERERCAKICADLAKEASETDGPVAGSWASSCANAILEPEKPDD